MPRALIVAVIDLAIGIEAYAAGAADAGAGGHHFAIRLDAQRPATKRHRAAERAGEAERDPEVARFVKAAADGVFVVVAGDAPVIAHVVEDIRTAIAIDILQTGDLVACGGVDVFVLRIVGDAEHLVQATGEELVAHGGGIIAARAADDPDLTTSRAHDQPAIWQQVDGADLERGFLRCLKGGDLVVVRLRWDQPRKAAEASSKERRRFMAEIDGEDYWAHW
jgi:hypothetical protein